MEENLTKKERKKLQKLENQVQKRKEKEQAIEYKEKAQNNRILDENGIIVTTIWAQTLKLIFLSFFFLMLGIAIFWGWQSYIGNYKSDFTCNNTVDVNQVCGNLSSVCEKSVCNPVTNCGNTTLIIINNNGTLTDNGTETNSTS